MEDLKREVARALDTLLREAYDAAPEKISVEYPPHSGMGDLASPVAFEMAKRLRRPPRQIAQELADAIAKRIEGELQYPGQIKVTVIRETRAVGLAR